MEIYFDYKDEFEASILTKYNDVIEDWVFVDVLFHNKLIRISWEKCKINKFLDSMIDMQVQDISLYQLFSSLALNYILDSDEDVENKVRKLQKLPQYKIIKSNIDIFETYFVDNKKFHPLKYDFSKNLDSISLNLQDVFWNYFSFDFEKSKFVFVDYWEHFQDYKIFAKYIIENF